MHELFHEPATYPVWARTGDRQLRRCRLGSVNDDKARLQIEEPCELPEQFDLLFSPNAQSWRECEVVWRSSGQNVIGIRFLARHLSPGPTPTASTMLRAQTG